jgi:hypothetical protein
MKILCFILSLYVLFQIAVPCCSEDNCNEEMAIGHTDSPQEHEEGDCNTCSPFFTCGTCSGFVFTKWTFNFKEVSFLKDKLVPVYIFPFPPHSFDKIWQPPKWIKKRISGFATFC